MMLGLQPAATKGSKRFAVRRSAYLVARRMRASLGNIVGGSLRVGAARAIGYLSSPRAHWNLLIVGTFPVMIDPFAGLG